MVAEPGTGRAATPIAMSGGQGEVRRFRARHGHRRRARGVPAEQDEGDGAEDWWDPNDGLQAEADGPSLVGSQNVGGEAGGNYFATNDAATSFSPPRQDGGQHAAADYAANGQFEMTGPAMPAAAPSFPDPSANNMSPMQNAWTMCGTMLWEMPITAGVGPHGQALHGALPHPPAVPLHGGLSHQPGGMHGAFVPPLVHPFYGHMPYGPCAGCGMAATPCGQMPVLPHGLCHQAPLSSAPGQCHQLP